MTKKPTYKELELRVKALEKEALERKQDNEFSLRGKDFSESIIDSLPGIFYLFDEKGKFIRWNKNLESVSGYSGGEISAMSPIDFIAGEDKRNIAEKIQDVFMKGEASFEADFVSKSGYRTPYYFTGRRVKVGDANYLAGMGINTTDRKQAEEALRESEERFRSIIENTDAGYFFIDKGGFIQDVNESWVKMYGYSSKDQIIGQHFAIIQKADDIEKAKEFVNGIMRGDAKYVTGEFSRKCKDGTIGYHTFSARPVSRFGEVIGIEGFIIDTTERRGMEEILRVQGEIAANMSEGVYLIRVSDGVILYTNPKFEQIFDYDPGEMVGKYVSIVNASSEMTPEETVDHIVGIIKQTGLWKGEIQNIKKDGTPFWCYSSASLFDHPEYGEIIVSVHTDIDKRKQAEEALRESEENFRVLYNNSPDMHVSVSPHDANILLCNETFLNKTGYSREEIIGSPVFKIYHDDCIAEAKKTFQEFVETGVIKDRELTLKRKDGSKIDVSLNVNAIRDEAGEIKYSISSWRDITDRKKAEEEKKRLEAQLQETEKMEAIAILAGGVAHEFNNTLMGIMGNIELLKMNFSGDGGIDKHLESMKSAGHRMSRLTDQLLAYAEGGKYQPKDLKMDHFVIETLPILQHDLNPKVRIETHFPKDVSYIKADYAQMQMVLSAILTNANEAIEDEGIIRIAAGNKELDEDFTNQHPGLKPGPYVCLTIEDDGKGMDEETRNGIFEPFFTTKFQGRGMGMAAVYGIVMNHDGWIYVDSELGKGTVVQIYLPAIEIEVEKPKKAKVEITTGSGTILMIEDEDVVIEVTQAMLEWLGYRVMVAKTGKDAIHITETFDGQIDLALLDIKLPDIDGRKLYPLIMKARSNLKVIVFSGYSIDGPAREILDAGAQDFIQKPFSLATLSEKLKEVLGGK